jgi:hypothetical protein
VKRGHLQNRNDRLSRRTWARRNVDQFGRRFIEYRIFHNVGKQTAYEGFAVDVDIPRQVIAQRLRFARKKLANRVDAMERT